MSKGNSELPVHSSIIIWPISCISAESTGLILGWVENDTREDDNINTVTTTTICIGLIRSLDERHIQNVLNEWSRQYRCSYCHSSDETKCKNNTVNDDNNAVMNACCTCATCVLHGRLQIVGIWSPSNDNTITIRNGKKSSLPHIELTQYGPWWKESDLNQKQERQQLLFYDHCDETHSYYNRHGSFGVYSSCKPTAFGFDRTLLRISEGFELFKTFQQHYFSTLERICNAGSLDDDDYKDKNSSRKPTHDVPKQNGKGVEESSFHNPKKTSKITDAMDHPSLYQRLKKFLFTHSLLFIDWKHKGYSSISNSNSSRFAIFNILQLLREKSIYTLHFEIDSNHKKEKYFIPHEIKAKRLIFNFENSSSLAIDGFLGIIFGIFLLWKTEFIITYLGILWNTLQTQMLRNNVGWLETFPMGFKLNVPLTRKMGAEIISLITLHDWLSQVLLLTDDTTKDWLLKWIGFVGMTFGFSTLVATIFDIFRLGTIHLYLLYTIFQRLYSVQLYLFAVLWRLFCGKKKNVLRNRTDTLEYDSTQLLLGMILFTVVLFLFTTILVYYTFFTIIYLSVCSVCVIMWLAYVVIRNIPLGTYFLRIKHPNWFTRNVYIAELSPSDIKGMFELREDDVSAKLIKYYEDEMTANRVVTRLVRVPESPSAIVSDAVLSYFTVLLAAIPSFLVEIFSGSPCKVLTVCLQNSSPSQLIG